MEALAEGEARQPRVSTRGREAAMGHTFSNMLLHVVFSTKDRRNSLYLKMREDLFHYIRGILTGEGCRVWEINGVDEHIHIMFALKPTMAVSELMRKLKANSSKWIHEQYPGLRDFQWQAGFSVFSVSESVREQVAEYIRQQPAHHHRIPFSEELKSFLEKNGIEYDSEHYLD